MIENRFNQPKFTDREHRSAVSLGTCVVLGLGATGLSCARYLDQAGFSIMALDSRDEPPGAARLRQLVPAATILTGTLEAELPADTVQVILSPGLAPELPLVVQARGQGLPVVGDIELFALNVTRPVAAITGSNGKSTVTTMLASMAEACGQRVLAGGNLGTPALDLLEGSPPQLFVLELSSFQLEMTRSLKPAVATVLNVSADHIDRHGSLEAYAAAKARIFHGARIVVANRQDPLVMAMNKGQARTVTFGLDTATDGDFGVIGSGKDLCLAQGGKALMPAAELGVAGLHNVANALAALAMGDALGLPMGPMLSALRRFRGLPHRTQLVADVLGMRWIDDSKATNVGAAVAAIDGLPGPIVLIAGGDGKGQVFAPLASALRGRARAAVLLGRDAAQLADVLDGVCPVTLVEDMAGAVKAAAHLGQPGDTVLLSPACSSLDMFRSFAERGDVFTTSVRSLLS